MGAQQYCTGAIHVFVGTAGTATNKQPEYLGTMESRPRVETDRSWDSLMNDLAGTQLPFDYIYEGEEAILNCVFTRFDYLVMKKLENMPDLFSGTRGENNYLERGSLMSLENLAIPVWWFQTFGEKVAMQNMGFGKKYLQAIPWGPDSSEGGTSAHKRQVIFRAWGQYVPASRKFRLFEDVTSLPAQIS